VEAMRGAWAPRSHHSSIRRPAAGVLALLLLAGLLVPSAVLAAPASKFRVTIASPQSAGVAFSVTIEAVDRSNKVDKSYKDAHCLVIGGADPSPDGTQPVLPDAGGCTTGRAVIFDSGVATTEVTLYKAGSTTLSFTEASTGFTGSATFTVSPGDPAAVAFTDQPIDTETGTPIYSRCVPASSGTNPCAAAGGNGSSPVRVFVSDAYGNGVANGTQVAISGAATGSAGTTDGFAAFGDSLGAGPATGGATTNLVATVTNVPPATSAPFRVVNELSACNGKSCANTVTDPLTRSYGRIDTQSDFFDDSTDANVLLSTTFEDNLGAPENACNGRAGISRVVDLMIQGTLASTDPNKTFVLVIPKDALVASGLASRDAASFDVCLGAFRFDESVPVWKVRNADGTLRDATADGGTPTRYWGVAADCGTPGLGPADPCVSLKTKNTTALSRELGIPSKQIDWFKDSDIAVVVRVTFPWDPKGAML